MWLNLYRLLFILHDSELRFPIYANNSIIIYRIYLYFVSAETMITRKNTKKLIKCTSPHPHRL